MKNRRQKNHKVRLGIIALFMLMLVGVSGCQKKAKEEDVELDLASAPKNYMITKDNYFDYQSGMECSAFASAFLLRSFGQAAEGMALFEDFPNKAPDGGIMPYGIETFFKERGYQAEYICNGSLADLKAQVALDTPVIVFIHISEPTASLHNTHYVPVVGYDEDYLYLAESILKLANCMEEEDKPYNRRIENSEFMLLWENIDGIWDYPYFKIAQ